MIDAYTIFFLFVHAIIIDVPASLWSFACSLRVTAPPYDCTYTRLRRKRIPRKDTAGFETGESSLLVHRFSARRGKEERRFHGTVSKVADTGRGGGSRALVAWLDRHAALPRDTLLKQRTTLKFSESTGCVCKGNKSWLLEMRGIVACLEILNFGIY